MCAVAETDCARTVVDIVGDPVDAAVEVGDSVATGIVGVLDIIVRAVNKMEGIKAGQLRSVVTDARNLIASVFIRQTVDRRGIPYLGRNAHEHHS